MPVVDKLINASLYNDRAVVRCFSSRAAFFFPELRVSFVHFMTYVPRTMY